MAMALIQISSGWEIGGDAKEFVAIENNADI